MIDKKLEDNIKKAKEFIEMWEKFYGIFNNTISVNHVSDNKEEEFLSVKNLANARYEDLMDSLEVKPLKRFIISPAVYNIISLDKLSIMSDEKLGSARRDWGESLTFLKALLARLEKKKERIRGFSRFAFMLKKGIHARRRRK